MPGCQRPAIVTRAEWGCPDGATTSHGEPSYTLVTHLVLHHTGTSNLAPDPIAVVRSIWNYHVFANGWSDIGYNYLIDRTGNIYEGRAGGDDVIGAHFICANEGTCGIGLIGTFVENDPAPASQAISALEDLLAWLCERNSIDPLSSKFHAPSQLELPSICGHLDGNDASPESDACPKNTQCPGEKLYALLPEIRGSVSNRVRVPDDYR